MLDAEEYSLEMENTHCNIKAPSERHGKNSPLQKHRELLRMEAQNAEKKI